MSLTMQGEFTQLLVDEEENVMWQSVVRNVPRGVLSFALRSATNSLPSPDNLRRWGKRNVSTCPLCLNHGTLQHILNFCSVSLNQGRFTCLAPRLCTKIHHRNTWEGKTWKYGDLLWSFGKPIICFHYSSRHPTNTAETRLGNCGQERKIHLHGQTLGLLESNFEAADSRKRERYLNLKSDIEDRGFKCFLFPLEVGSRGHISKKNKRILTADIPMTHKIRLHNASVLKDLSKISLLCSYSIFHAYSQPSWSEPPLLEP